jgi:hypothetical protein
MHAKIALGTMQQSVSVNGYRETNDFTDFGPTQVFSGGYFALPSNSGEHPRNTFAVVPEIGVNLGYRLSAIGCRRKQRSSSYTSFCMRAATCGRASVSTATSTRRR